MFIHFIYYLVTNGEYGHRFSDWLVFRSLFLMRYAVQLLCLYHSVVTRGKLVAQLSVSEFRATIDS